jgi:hypothetical protein
MCFEIRSLPQVKTVRGESADTRTKSHVLAVIFFRMFDQPIEQLAAIAFRSLAASRH